MRTGHVIDVDAQATEVYNAALRAIGIMNRVMDGNPGFTGQLEPAILV